MIGGGQGGSDGAGNGDSIGQGLGYADLANGEADGWGYHRSALVGSGEGYGPCRRAGQHLPTADYQAWIHEKMQGYA